MMNILVTSNLALKGKKAYASYTAARTRLSNSIKELQVDEEKQSVFDKLKKSTEKVNNTIFGKLKYMNKDK